MSSIPADSDDVLEIPDVVQPETVRPTAPTPRNRRASDGLAAPPKAVKSDSQFVVYVLAFGGFLVYCAAMAWSNKSWWIWILFSLPMAAQVVGGGFHIFHHSKDHQFFYKLTMGLSWGCLVTYCGLWVWYDNDGGGYQILSILCLVIVAFLLLVIGCMMSAFMKEPRNKDSNLKKIRDGAAQEPLWAMSFLFFVIFLDVTYLFGFAFAFHDKHCLKATNGETPALQMVNYDSADDVDPMAAPAVAANRHGTQGLNDGAGRINRARPPAGVDSKFYFYFLSGQAQLDTGKLDYGKCELPIGPQEPAANAGQAIPLPVSTPVAPPLRSKWLQDWFSSGDLQKESSQPFNKLFNSCSLERLRLRVEDETKKGAQVRLVLIGQGDKQPITDQERRPKDALIHYRSNYELSEARVHNLRYELTEALKNENDTSVWRNLEWLTLPSSDEKRADDVLKYILDNFTNLQSRKEELEGMNERVVTVTVVPIKGDVVSTQVKRDSDRKLELIDYMYFSIYTITTTGYGDIIPTTAYSKFVISIANICEVLFLVVFFNALVSIRRNERVG